jgi:hypothetical protein
MNSSECLQIVLIVVCSFGLLFFLANYNNMMPGSELTNIEQRLVKNIPHVQESFTEYLTDDKPENKVASLTSDDAGGQSVSASEGIGRNEVYQSIGDGKQGLFGLAGNKQPADCYPKDQLSPEDLLPGDAGSVWAKNAPVTGDLKDQNFLQAGWHTGVNTVGQSLRNANQQLRSEPPNPQVKVSPWMQTTIDPDLNRRPMEIGGCD